MMKIYFLLSIGCLVFVETLHVTTSPAFHFVQPSIPYCSKFEFLHLLQGVSFSAEKEQRLYHFEKDFLWHLKIPTVGMINEKKKVLSSEAGSVSSEIFLWDLAVQKGKGVKIAVLDMGCDNQKSFDWLILAEKFCAGEIGHFTTKNDLSGTVLNGNSNDGKTKDRLAYLMKKKDDQELGIKKNHADVTSNIIKQFAPYATIIFIPIMDEYGFTSKKKLCLGLQKAFETQVDIVHLGLKIIPGMNHHDFQDREIISWLQKIPYVVVAAGNDGRHETKLAYPACLPEIFFSVGAFEYKNNHYPVCDFSQRDSSQRDSSQSEEQKGPNFLLPGSRMVCPMWSQTMQDYVFTHVAGTSMAAAMMTGFLALLLAEHASDFSQDEIKQVMAQCSKKLEKEWDNNVKFGTIDMRETEAVLYILKSIKKNISLYRYKKNFLKIIKIIKESLDVDFFKRRNFDAQGDKEFVKKTYIYADNLFHKKIDRGLYLLVQDSIYALKESTWKKKYISLCV